MSGWALTTGPPTVRGGALGGGQFRLGQDRLEELDGIARGVVDQDLAPTDAGDDVVAEVSACRPQHVDQRLEPIDFDREAVPPAGVGTVPSGIAWPPPPGPPGALSVSRRSPRDSIAKVGAGCITSVNPRCPQ